MATAGQRAPRTRGNIQNFFRNGARARGWVNSGADGIPNNADDILIVTGETLAQVQDRVLGVGVNSAPLVHGGQGIRDVWRAIRPAARPAHDPRRRRKPDDENYRGISWGMDAPGRGLSVRYMYRF